MRIPFLLIFTSGKTQFLKLTKPDDKFVKIHKKIVSTENGLDEMKMILMTFGISI